MVTSGYKKAGGKLALFLKQNWIYVLIAIVLIPLIWRIFLTQLSGQERREQELEKDRWFRDAQDPAKLNQKWDEYLNSQDPDSFATDHDQLKDAARRVIEGFNINIWDSDQWITKLNPEGWFEQPELYMPVFLNESIQYDFVHLAELYYIGTRVRDLDADIVRILSYKQQKDLKDNGYTFLNLE